MKKKLLKLLWIMCGLGLLSGIFAVGTLAFFSFGLPKIATLSDYNPPIPSKILSSDGTVLAEIGKERREIATFDEIPQVIVDAFLSAEDSGFYGHTGVDYLGIARAMLKNIRAGRVVQGGSTITQQVAKSLLLTSERSISRKIKDLLLARKIEQRFTKQEILFLYLNQVYLGGGYYGVKTAFDGYYGKQLNEATVAESAMIAGLLVAPGRYSPYLNPRKSLDRQRYVLGRMRANGKISETQYQEAMNEKIKFRLRRENFFKAGYFTDWVRQRVMELVGEEKFKVDGFKVVTTIDWELQKVAEEEVAKGVRAIDKRQGFKGPIKTFETPEAIEEYKLQFRKKMLRDKSIYFTINDDYSRKYEVEFNEEEYKDFLEEQALWSSELRNKRFSPGLKKGDPLIDMLEVDESYEVVVEKLDNWARLVYVSIGGVPGIISYEGFRWAHPREIAEEYKYHPFVMNPSKILKVGDVVLAKLKRKSTGMWRYANKNFKKKYKTNKKIDEVKKQRYLYFTLDQYPDAQGALFSMNPHNGDIIAFVGGADFRKSQFNRATQSLRQPGSSFKPILFAAGLENGYSPASIIIDSPEALGGADASLNWKPRNYDGKFKGPITFRNSLEQSRNVPTIKIAEKITVPKILDFVDRIGFNAKLDHDLSLSLGSFGVTLKDIVSTYSIFPNGGKIIDSRSIVSIEDRHGNVYHIDENDKLNKIRAKESFGDEEEVEDAAVISDDSTQNGEEEVVEKETNPYLLTLGGEQVYDSRLAYQMTNLLKGVVLNGTGRSAKNISHFIGGKTGTTNNYVDAWFIGFSSNVATGVWTGFDDNKSLGFGETGAKSALPVWKNFMQATINKYGEHDFKTPPGIVHVAINKETGKLSKEDGGKPFTEAFVEGTEPVEDSGKLSDDEINSDESQQEGLLEEDDYYDNQ